MIFWRALAMSGVNQSPQDAAFTLTTRCGRRSNFVLSLLVMT